MRSCGLCGVHVFSFLPYFIIFLRIIRINFKLLKLLQRVFSSCFNKSWQFQCLVWWKKTSFGSYISVVQILKFQHDYKRTVKHMKGVNKIGSISGATIQVPIEQHQKCHRLVEISDLFHTHATAVH